MSNTIIDNLENVGQSPNIRDTYTYKQVSKENIYTFMDNCYEGTGGYRDGTYLVPHTREMFYEKRKDLAFYKNYVKPIIDAQVIPVFNKPIARKSNNDLFSNFIGDCDNLGTPLQSFMEDVLINARLHGICFVVVDNFPLEQQPALEGEAIEKRIFPYVYLKKANEFISSTLYQTGIIKSIIFSNEKLMIAIEGKEVLTDTYIRFTEMTTEIIYKGKKEDEWLVYSTFTHNLGVVPVIPVYSIKRKARNNLMVDPPLYDLGKINLAIFNKDSEIRELERSQGFSIFYLQTDNSGNLTVGANNVLFLPMGTTITPGFASPDASIQKNLVDFADRLKEDLFRIAEQHGVTGVKDQKSGIALQWDFYAHESVLKKTSMIATITEQKISYIFGKYINQEIEYEVHYPTSFQPNDKLEMIRIFDMYLQFDLPPLAKSMAIEKVTRMLFSEKNTEDLEDVIAEIENRAQDEINSKKEETIEVE